MVDYRNNSPWEFQVNRVEVRSVKPVMQAMILADRIYEDKSTGKKVIAGTFNKLLFGKVPSPQPPDQKGGEEAKPSYIQGGTNAGSPYIYISLTDLHGAVPLVLRYMLLDDDHEFFRCDLQVESNDPLKTIEVVLPLPNLPTPKAGIYAIELWCHDEPLGTLRIVAEEISFQSP